MHKALRSPLPARTARRLPAQSGPVPVAVMAASSHGARRRQQPAPALHLLPLRPRPGSAPLQAPVAAPVKSGSTPPVKSTTAPVIAGTARPSTAATCPRCKRRHRGQGPTTERLAPRRGLSERAATGLTPPQLSLGSAPTCGKSTPRRRSKRPRAAETLGSLKPRY